MGYLPPAALGGIADRGAFRSRQGWYSGPKVQGQQGRGIAAAERGETGEDGGPVLAATAGSGARRRGGDRRGEGRWIGGGGGNVAATTAGGGGGGGGGDGLWKVAPPSDLGLETGTNPNR